MSKRVVRLNIDTESRWQSLNPILLDKVKYYATDSIGTIIGTKIGIGDRWNDTPYQPSSDGNNILIYENDNFVLKPGARIYVGPPESRDTINEIEEGSIFFERESIIAPTNLQLSLNNYNTINLTWEYIGNTHTGFSIYTSQPYILEENSEGIEVDVGEYVLSGDTMYISVSGHTIGATLNLANFEESDIIYTPVVNVASDIRERSVTSLEYNRTYSIQVDAFNNNVRSSKITNTITTEEEPSQAGIELDLVHYWNFEESSGDLLDQIGDSDGTITGSPSREQSGLVNQCYSLGSDGQIDISSIDLSNKDFSISFALNGVSYAMAIRHGQGGANADLHIGYVASGGGSFRIDFGGGNSFTFGGFTAGVVGNWNTFVISFNSSTKELNIYHNGSLLATRTTTSNYLGNGTLSFGRVQYSSSDKYTGRIDEVRIWERALNSNDVIALEELYT